MGATNRATLGYVAEITKGVTPANPAFTAMRNTSNALALTPTRVSSDEIRSDRQVTEGQAADERTDREDGEHDPGLRAVVAEGSDDARLDRRARSDEHEPGDRGEQNSRFGKNRSEFPLAARDAYPAQLRR